MRCLYFCWAFAYGLLLGTAWARDLKFNVSKANQCDPLIVQIFAGEYAYPLILTVTPFEHKPLNFTIDKDSQSPNGAQNFTIPNLPWEEGRQLLVTLSDQSGFASCGTSDTLIVGASVTGTKCNVTLPTLDFFFNLDSDLIQCQPYPITRFTRATQPVKIFFQIPLGDSFAIQAPISSVYTYNWIANFKAGTPIVFTMIDALGKNGGSSGARIVGESSNHSCLGGNSKGHLSSGAIAGIVIVIVVMAFGAVVAFLYTRKRRRSNKYLSVNLNDNGRNLHIPSEYQTTPFILPETSPVPSLSSKRYSPLPPTPISPDTPSDASRHSRLIVHRDITEDGAQDGSVVELPPQYSARRAPIPGITPPRAGPSSSSAFPNKSARRTPR